MILLTVNDKKTFPLDFINKLKIIFKHRFILLLNTKKLKQFEDIIKLKYELKKFDIETVCFQAIDTSLVIENHDNYQLIIDPNKRINNLKVSSIIKFINDGDLENQPYPIFTEISNYIESNLDNIFQLYQMGIVI